MRTWHGDQVNWVASLLAAQLAVPLVVSETVFDPDNDPIHDIRATLFSASTNLGDGAVVHFGSKLIGGEELFSIP